MKSNLDQMFKTDKALESEGIEIDFGIAKFKVKRFGGYNSKAVKAALAKYYKPLTRQIEMDAVPIEKEQEIMVKIFVESSMIGWEGVEIDGAKIPYTEGAAIKLFIELPELFEEVKKQATSADNFKEQLGNS